MAWVWPAIAAGTAIYSAVSANKSRKETNEQEVELANSAVTRRMADLNKAGINPALGYLSGASGAQTPNLESERYEHLASAGDKASSAYTQSYERTMKAAQTENLVKQNALLDQQTNSAEAQARIDNVRAAQAEAELPYSAERAKMNQGTLEANYAKLGYEIRNLSREANLADLTFEDRKVMQKLANDYQSMLTQAAQLGIPAKEAESAFWKQTGVSASWADKLKDFFLSGAKTYAIIKDTK